MNQYITLVVVARASTSRNLCERREEFNEVRGEYWSDSCSANAYVNVNASLKSLILIGTHYQLELDGPWATKITVFVVEKQVPLLLKVKYSVLQLLFIVADYY